MSHILLAFLSLLTFFPILSQVPAALAKPLNYAEIELGIIVRCLTPMTSGQRGCDAYGECGSFSVRKTT